MGAGGRHVMVVPASQSHRAVSGAAALAAAAAPHLQRHTGGAPGRGGARSHRDHTVQPPAVTPATALRVPANAGRRFPVTARTPERRPVHRVICRPYCARRPARGTRATSAQERPFERCADRRRYAGPVSANRGAATTAGLLKYHWCSLSSALCAWGATSPAASRSSPSPEAVRASDAQARGFPSSTLESPSPCATHVKRAWKKRGGGGGRISTVRS